MRVCGVWSHDDEGRAGVFWSQIPMQQHDSVHILFVFTLSLTLTLGRLYTHMHVACGAETKLMSFCGLLMPQGGATSASKLWASSSSRI